MNTIQELELIYEDIYHEGMMGTLGGAIGKGMGAVGNAASGVVTTANDLLGFIPIVGEFFDASNVVIYLAKAAFTKGDDQLENLFYALLSLVSAIPLPGVMDAAGKGTKYAFKLSKPLMKGGSKGAKITEFISKNPKLAKALNSIDSQKIEAAFQKVANTPMGNDLMGKLEKYVGKNVKAEFEKDPKGTIKKILELNKDSVKNLLAQLQTQQPQQMQGQQMQMSV